MVKFKDKMWDRYIIYDLDKNHIILSNGCDDLTKQCITKYDDNKIFFRPFTSDRNQILFQISYILSSLLADSKISHYLHYYEIKNLPKWGDQFIKSIIEITIRIWVPEDKLCYPENSTNVNLAESFIYDFCSRMKRDELIVRDDLTLKNKILELENEIKKKTYAEIRNGQSSFQSAVHFRGHECNHNVMNNFVLICEGKESKDKDELILRQDEEIKKLRQELANLNSNIFKIIG